MYPSAAVYVIAKSLTTFFTHDGIATLVIRSGYSEGSVLPLIVIARLFWIVITIAACIGGIIYVFRERSVIAIMCVTLVAYFALTSTIAAFGTNPRYRLPVDPIILALAGIGAMYVRERIQSFRNHL